MRRLADEKLQITLALSLHASSQEKRKTLMPVAYKFDLKDVLDACRYYFEQTGRRITFEYSLVGGVNDSSEDARELTELVKDLNCHINLTRSIRSKRGITCSRTAVRSSISKINLKNQG